jgi:uncharacterized protein
MFVIIYTPGPAWIQGKSFSEQPLMEHGHYLQQLFVEQLLLLGGPFTDATGGMAVIDTESSAEAQVILDQDPAVLKKVFLASLHPWYTVFDVYAGRSLKSRPGRA